MAAFINDGAIPYGSQVLTALATTTATTGTTYIADNIEFQNPSKEINRTDQLDEPSGSVNYDDFQRGTATLQLATTGTAAPAKGAIISPVFAGVTVTCFIFDVSTPQSKDGAHTCNITFKKLEN